MQVPPPVFSQVPPPPGKKPIKWPLIIALSMIGVGVVGFTLLMVVGSSMGLFPDSTPKRKGIGRPVLVKHLDGRDLYAFPEVPMKMELPGKPKPYDKFEWDSDSASGIDSWIGYRWDSDIATYNLFGIWARYSETIDLDESMESLRSGYTEAKGFKDFVCNTSKKKIGTLDGRLLEAKYRWKTEKRAMRLFLWAEGDHLFYLSMHALEENQEYGTWEHDEILKSIELR